MTDSTERPEDGRSPFDGENGSAADRGEAAPESSSGPDATGTATTSAVSAPAADGGDAFRRARRRAVVPIAAVAVVAALIGGGLGAGIALAANPATAVTGAASSDRSGIVINNPSSATTVSAVAAKASPSVVTISVAASSESGTGSGIVLTSDGYVLTNNHVVTLDGDTSSGTISVSTTSGRIYTAKVVKTDPLNDLAVIKLQNASGLTAATFADSGKLNVGDPVVAIGAPLNLPDTVTTGIISAQNRSISVASSAVPNSSGSQDDSGQGESPFNFWNFGGQTQQQTQTTNISLSVLQTDAAINPGNSGGALLNAQGEVIGVNVAIAGTGSSSSGQSGSIGVGFAIPSNVAKRIGDELMAGKTVTHGQLGVSASAATTGGIAGAAVATVSTGGAAAKAGIQKGDVITAVDGVAIAESADLVGQIRSYAGGSTVQVTYARNGASSTVKVVLGSVSAGS